MKSVLKSVTNKGKAVVSGAIQSVSMPPPVNVAGKQLRFEKKLGEGGFAIVYLCKDESENLYALKKCLVQTPEQMKCMQSELELLKLLKHQHVISVVGSEKKNVGTHTEFYILMEYAEKSLLGMMQERHAENRRFSEKEVLRIFSDVVVAVAHCHSQNPPVAHRDLKLENVLLGHDKLFKLCDFGSCIRSAYEPQNYRDCNAVEDEIERNTTLCYRSPEMCDLLSKKRIDEKCDIWALGCLLFYLCFFELPFEEQKLQIISGRYTIPSDHAFRSDIIELIVMCLTVDPAERPDIWTVAEFVAQLRGTASKVPRPETSTPQPVTIGGTPLGSEPRPPKPAAPKPAAAGPKPGSGLPAAVSGGLFSQLDWQASDGKAVKPAATAASSPRPSQLPLRAPAGPAKPSGDFAMPSFDDLSLSPPKTVAPASPDPAFDIFAAAPPPAQPFSAGLDDFDFNPRGFDPSPAVVITTTTPFDLNDAFDPRATEAAPVSASLSPATPSTPATDGLFGDDLFAPASSFAAGPTSPVSSASKSKAAGSSSVDSMASDLLAGFLSSSTAKAPSQASPPKPAYTPMASKAMAAGPSPQSPCPNVSSGPAKDPFACLF